METSIETGYTGGESAGTEENETNSQRLPREKDPVEMGGGYGDPGDGSGETIPAEQATNDQQLPDEDNDGGINADPDLIKSDQVEDEDDKEDNK